MTAAPTIQDFIPYAEKQLAHIVDRLLMLEACTDPAPYRDWRSNIETARREITIILEKHPSLFHTVRDELLPRVQARARKGAWVELRAIGYPAAADALPAKAAFTWEQITLDWFPPGTREPSLRWPVGREVP